MSSDTKSSFWSSLSLYIERPNLINKRLMGSCVLHCWPMCEPFDTLYELLKNSSLNELKERLKHCRQLSDFQLRHIMSIDGQVLVVRQLLLKLSLKSLCSNRVSEVFDFVLIDVPNAQTVFVPKVTDSHIIPESCHKIFLNESQEIEIQYLSQCLPNEWLNAKVLPKLNQWMSNDLEGNQSKGSLQLVGVDSYCLTYNRLKTTYGKRLVDLWRKYETTDPLKFVFEDIAIASYLIVLWEQQNQKNGSNRKQSFVDIGCGNGLLVYLLTNEGYKGLGIDLRKRNIWDKYEPWVDLAEKVFTPSDETIVFKDYDWLIGNHSDELTVWIPWIAANSSQSANVFLLPCCPFDFNGAKYIRTSSNISQYNCYVNYVQTVCHELGFATKVDKLRIPSTKRICIVCDERNYDKTIESEMISKRKAFICAKLNDFATYKPRDKVEAVRNCTRVPRDIINTIVTIIVNELFKGRNDMTISCVPKLLTKDLLRELKTQCGGIQTLLRNHKYIFEVRNGLIAFNQPKPIEPIGSDDIKSHKSKECWFFRNHPNGCPLADIQCRYIH